MDPLFGFTLLYTLVISGSMLTVRGSSYSSPDTAIRFAQCLIEKMGDSQMFTQDDRNSMVEITNVMAEAMSNQYQAKFTSRSLLAAFFTSMADVITDEDVIRNADRKKFYAAALEQCSLSTLGYVDSEFLQLALRILFSLESRKFSPDAGSFQGPELGEVDVYGRNVNPGGPNLFFPLFVHPSPVRNPYISEEFYLNDKTVFEFSKPGPGDFHPIPSKSIDSNVPPQFQTQMASNVGVSSSIGSVPRKEADLPSEDNVPSSEINGATHFDKTYQDASVLGGLNVPQTKESSVIVIPPVANSQQPSQNNRFQQSFLETNEGHENVNNNAPQGDVVDIIPSESRSYADVDSQNVQAGPSLENMVFNILMQSETFRSMFNFDIPQEIEIDLARTIAGKSLNGYNSDVINEILDAVTAEFSRVTFRSSENYALALSNAIVRVLKLNNFPLFNDGIEIASNFLHNLETVKQLLSREETFDKSKELSGDVVNPEGSDEQVDYFFESSPLSPEDREGEIFSENLARQLSESDELSRFFCNNTVPENTMKIYFSIIKSSLADYGPHISSLAASIASGVLADLSREELCSNYAQTISEVIAEVLDENGVIAGANAGIISNKMTVNLGQHIINTESQKTESTLVKISLNETAVPSNDSMPTLQSSFANNFSNVSIAPSAPNDTSLGDMTPHKDVNYSLSDYFPSATYHNDTESHSLSVPPSSSEMSMTEYASIVTTPYITEITDEAFTSAATSLEEIISSISTISPINPSLDWAPNDTIQQEELEFYLLEELESVLDAYYDKDGESQDSGNPFDEILSLSEADKDSGRTSNLTQLVNNLESRNSRNESESNVSTRKKDRADNDSDYAHKKRRCKNSTEARVASSFPVDSIVEKDLVVLQPSFREPQSAEYSTRKVLPSNSGSVYGETASQDLIAKARDLTRIATSTITYIRSTYSGISRLCARINKFAPIVNIPPLDYCEKTAAIDYLLNVLKAAIEIFQKA